MTANYTKTVRIAGTDARIISEFDFIQLSCGVNGCGSNCCTKSAPIVLNPYEIALICREGNMSYEDLLDIVDTDRLKGFPLVMLPRDPHCYFWSGKGCRIYRGRPLACRLYPLGRVFDQGESHLVLPELNICSGLSSSPAKTVAEYLLSQDTAVLIQMADHWIEFVSELEQKPLPDKPVTSVAFHMLVYSPDTPPAVGHNDLKITLEEQYILRITTARKQIPRYLDGR